MACIRKLFIDQMNDKIILNPSAECRANLEMSIR